MEPNIEPKFAPARMKFLYLKDLTITMSLLTKEMADIPGFVENLEIELNGNNFVIIEKRMALINLHIKMNFQEAEKEPVLLLHYNCEVAFEIENFEEIFFPHKEGIYIANKKTTYSLMSIALSTTRGVLIEKTANSSLKYVPLPIVNTGQLEVGTLYSVITL